MQFVKRYINIAGNDIPGLQVSEPETEMVTLPARPGLPPRTIPAQFADIITYRSTNPFDGQGNPQEVTWYLTLTRENLRFATRRPDGDYVIGLDVDEEGNFLTFDDLEARRRKDIAARQVLRAQTQQPRVIPVTLDPAMSAQLDEAFGTAPKTEAKPA